MIKIDEWWYTIYYRYHMYISMHVTKTATRLCKNTPNCLVQGHWFAGRSKAWIADALDLLFLSFPWCHQNTWLLSFLGFPTRHMIEGSLNSKLPTRWRVEKQMRQAVKSEGRRCTSTKVRRKKTHPRQMLETSRNAVFFQWFVCRVSRKVGLLKRRVRR